MTTTGVYKPKVVDFASGLGGRRGHVATYVVSTNDLPDPSWFRQKYGIIPTDEGVIPYVFKVSGYHFWTLKCIGFRD